MAMENEAEDELGRREAESDSEIDDNVLTEKVLTEYDRTRRKVPIVRNRSIVMNTKILVTELTCPICLDLITSTMTTKLCLHRFCFDCICKSLSIGNKECPTCRSKLLSKRALRPDHNFDTLIRRICPDRSKYDEMLAIANQDGDDALYSVVAYADDPGNFGDRTHPDIYDPFDKDAPTPPALLDSRRTTSPMEMYGEGGRRTPPWFTMGQLHSKDMGEYENGIYMQTQKAYLKMKNNRLGARIAGIDRIFDCEATETYSKTSRETSSPRLEPHSKSRRINNGGSKRMIDDEKSAGSSIDSGESDSDNEGEAATVEIELDKDYIEEQEMMDNRLFLLNTSREVAKKGRTKDSREIKEASGEEGGSNISVNPSTSDDSLPTFDPRINPDPPYPDMVEYFAELMPNGRGATWQSVLENSVEQPQEDDPDEEMVFDEDDVLSVVSIDDLLYEIGDVAHEDEVEKSYAEKKPDGLFTDLSREIHEEKNKYMCEETRMHIREINELRGGGLIDMKATLEDTEQFDLGEATTWYSQTREGEEIVYYEKSKQPLSRGRRPVTKEYDVDEEVERICRRVTMKDIRDDMSNTDTDRCTPCTLSLASSPISSKLTLSDANDEEMKEESPAVDLPPLNPGQVKERLHRWIGDVTPNTPEQLDTPLDRSTMDEDDDEDCESLPENYEIEAELRPSAALLSRNVPCDVLQTRFIRTQHNTTVEHIGEFLYQRWLEDVHNKTTADEVAPDVPRPEHFYVFNRLDRNCKCVFIHEPLVTAQTLTARDDHVVIYFDTQRAEINSEQMSLLEKIVPHKDRTEPTPASSRDSTGSSSSR